MWHQLLTYAAIVFMLVANAAGVAMVALQLPGTWAMLAVTLAFMLIFPGWIGLWAFLALGLLAVLGEVVETVAGAAGSRKAGGSRRAMAGSIVGGIAGAILGTMFIPIPVVGTILGAVIGAGAGSIAGDRWAGRDWEASWTAGQGAAWGKLWGTLGKIAVAVIMWLVTAAAIFWPGA